MGALDTVLRHSFIHLYTGNIWAEAAKQYAAANNPRQQQQRTPRGGEGYSTTPRYDDPRRTPGYGGRTPSRTPAGQVAI